MRFLPPPRKQVDCAPFSMNGLHVAALSVGMLLVSAQGAAAQTCMCADAAALEPALDASARSAGELQQAFVAKDLSSRQREALAPQDGDDLPWCTSQDGAQCSKLPAGGAPSSMSVGAAPAATQCALPALPPPSSTVCALAEYACGGPRDAVRSKPERPPQ